MKVLVTGGAGFIGSNLSEYLLKKGHKVTILDDLSSGFAARIPEGVDFWNCDLAATGEQSWWDAFDGCDQVVHLAANVDNRFSWSNPYLPITSNVTATLNVAQAAIQHGVKKIAYSSTGTAYGDHLSPPYKESDASSAQTTLYGATKYAGEGILSVFAEHHGMSVDVFRFVGVLGPGYSHGHVFDFVKKLLTDSTRLEVLGDGYQKKSYVNVLDLCDAVYLTMTGNQTGPRFRIFNLGRRDYSTVRQSVSWVVDQLKLEPQVTYGESAIGWVGDNPHLYLDPTELEKIGWAPTKTIEESVRETAQWLSENRWIFEMEHTTPPRVNILGV